MVGEAEAAPAGRPGVITGRRGRTGADGGCRSPPRSSRNSPAREASAPANVSSWQRLRRVSVSGRVRSVTIVGCAFPPAFRPPGSPAAGPGGPSAARPACRRSPRRSPSSRGSSSSSPTARRGSRRSVRRTASPRRCRPPGLRRPRRRRRDGTWPSRARTRPGTTAGTRSGLIAAGTPPRRAGTTAPCGGTTGPRCASLRGPAMRPRRGSRGSASGASPTIPPAAPPASAPSPAPSADRAVRPPWRSAAGAPRRAAPRRPPRPR